MEEGFVVGVAGHGDVAGIAHDAVAPAEEGVVFIGYSFQHDVGAVVVGAAAADRSAFYGVAFGGDFVG